MTSLLDKIAGIVCDGRYQYRPSKFIANDILSLPEIQEMMQAHENYLFSLKEDAELRTNNYDLLLELKRSERKREQAETMLNESMEENRKLKEGLCK